MMKKLLVTASLAALAVAASPTFAGNKCGANGIQGDNLSNVNPYFYNGKDANGTTDSGIPHLPAYYGHMSTNNTYRFFNVNEMVATMIGEGKHGLWRTQDNGTVREYLATEKWSDGSVMKNYYNKKGKLIPLKDRQAKKRKKLERLVAKGRFTSQVIFKTGLPAGADITDPANLSALQASYTHLDAQGSWSVYRADGNQVNDNGTAGNATDDFLNYVDLPINHAKYDAKADGGYDAHAAIDLPSWYCTMSGPEYKYARAAIRFAFAQDGANQVGPLGVRAGLDVKENYVNVLRLESLPDGRAWVNTAADTRTVNADPQQLDWEAIDKAQTDYELYLVERPFFNEEYLFVMAVFSDGTGAADSFSYVRPDGDYYDHLVAQGLASTFDTTLDTAVFGVDGAGSKTAVPTSLYGVHHPGTGACPAVGGDFGAAYYGGSWPTTYQEVTPLCDAVLLDIKLYANLNDADNDGWDDKASYLANATIAGAENSGDVNPDGDPLTRKHTDAAGTYGAYDTVIDPYLAGAVNTEQFTATGTQEKVYQTANDAVTSKAPLPFTPSL